MPPLGIELQGATEGWLSIAPFGSRGDEKILPDFWFFVKSEPVPGVSQNCRSPVGQAVNGLAAVAQGASSALFPPPVDVRERGLQGGKGRFSASSLPEPGR